MKYFLVSLGFIGLLFACKKQPQDNPISFYKAETQCSERWQTGNYEIGTSEHENAVIQFLSDSLSVTVSDLQVTKESDSIVCQACTCENGYVIRFNAPETYKQTLLNAGFFEQ